MVVILTPAVLMVATEPQGGGFGFLLSGTRDGAQGFGFLKSETIPTDVFFQRPVGREPSEPVASAHFSISALFWEGFPFQIPSCPAGCFLFFNFLFGEVKNLLKSTKKGCRFVLPTEIHWASGIQSPSVQKEPFWEMSSSGPGLTSLGRGTCRDHEGFSYRNPGVNVTCQWVASN